MRTRRRPVVLLTLATLGAFGLVGCTPAAPASPEVIWTPAEPSGALESDPWVEAVRASNTAAAVAMMTRDYTSTALKDSTLASTISKMASFQQKEAESGRFFTAPGPTPMIPLGVTESGADKAVVSVCEAQEWYLDVDRNTTPNRIVGKVTEYEVKLLEDGTRRVDGGVAREECDITGVSVGSFDPQPEPAVTYAPEDVKVPK